MADANLFPDEAGFSPRPAWQVIEAARRRYLTGELTLPTSPATRIFLRDGLIYFAERSTDGSLPIRLMVEGVITREQMQRATVIVNGIEHVGRMFEADPSIDRASVELCAELFTDDVMIGVANVVVDSYELSLYRRHPSGIDRWYPHSVPVTGRAGDSQDGSATTRAAADAAAAKTAQRAKPRPEAQPREVQPSAVQPRQVQPREVQPREVQPPEVHVEAKSDVKSEVRAEVKTEVRAEPNPQPKPAQRPEPRNNLNAPPITQAVPVTAPAGSTVPPPPITQTVPAVPTISPIMSQGPVANMPPPTAQIPVTAPKVPSPELDAAVIADEVAEAIRRAFAGMGSG